MAVKILATRGTEAQIQAVSSASQRQGQIAYATDTKEFYVSDGTQFNKITDLESNGNFYVSGKVGIGTTSPSTKLHVDGNIRVGDVNDVIYSNRFVTLSNSNLLITANTGYDTTFTNGGSERMRITSGGQLLLNATTTSFSDKLYLNGDAYVNGAWRVGTSGTYVGKLYNTSGILTLESDSTRDIQFGSVTNGTAMFIEGTNGNVGIGTTSPTSKLHISTSDTTNLLQIDTDTHPNLMFVSSSGKIGFRTNQPEALFHLKANDGQVMYLESTDGGAFPELRLRKSSIEYGSIRYVRNGDLQIGNSDNDGGISLRGNNSSDHLVVTHAGNVGIGTTSPTAKTHIVGDSTSSADTSLLVEDSANADLLKVDNNGTITVAPYRQIQTSSSNAITIQSATHQQFKAWTNAFRWFTQNGTIMELTNDGKLGIGTTSPVGILHTYSTSAPVIESPSNAAMIIRRNDNVGYSSLIKYHSGNSEKFVAGLSDSGDFTGSTGEEYFIGTTKTNPLVVLKNDGKLGIGTTSPTSKLTISQSADSNGIEVIGFDDRSTDNIKMHINSSGSGEFLSSNGLRFNSVSGQVSFLYNSNLMMQIASTSVNIRDDIELAFGNDKDYSIGYNAADDTFRIVDGSNLSSNPRLTIASDGNVGIGITSPSALVHLNTSGVTTLRVDSTNSFGRGLKIETNGLDQNLTSDGGTFSIIGKYSTVWEMNTNVIIPQQYFYGGYVNFRKRGTTTNLAQIGLEDNSNTYFNTGNVGIGTTSPAAKLDVNGTISQTVDAATNEYPLSFYNSHAGTNFYLLRQRVVNTGNQVRTGLGVPSLPSCAFELGTNTDQIFKFATSGTITNVSTINGNNPLKINATEIRVGDTSGSVAANFNIVGDNNRVPLGIKQESGASQDRFITFRDSSNTEVLGIATTGGFTVTDSNLVKRFSFGHGYSPSPADGMGIGLDLKTENASGTVVSVGSIDVIQDDVSADLSSMRLSVGETTPTEIMRLKSDGKVGIGTTSPTEKLDVVGNIKASGTIKGKMEQMFACSFSDDLGTTKHYLSFTSNAEQTNVHADQAAMVMPYNGRVKSIQLRLSNIDADTTRTFGVETIATGINMYASSNNWTIEETEAYELAATDDFYLVNYVFSNENHFESGDLLAISIQDTEDAYTSSRQTYVNVVIEYDLNNGMGNDTATTKYTS